MDTKTRDFFNERAVGWMERCWQEYFAGRAPDLPGKIEALCEAAGVAGDVQVLDVGCGDGFLVPFLLPRLGPGAGMTEMDIAEAMIAENRRRHQDPRLRFVVADVAELAATHAFDVVLAFSCFPHFPDPVPALRRLRGQLRPGGRLAVCHTKSSAEMNAFHRQAHPDVAQDCLPTIERMGDLMREAGLTPIRADERAGFYLAVGRHDTP